MNTLSLISTDVKSGDHMHVRLRDGTAETTVDPVALTRKILAVKQPISNFESLALGTL